MRRSIILALAAVMLLTVVAPVFASECCAPWCGSAKSMGYWKNDGIPKNDMWPCTNWSFGPSGGDYKQIFMNQAIAFRNNWMANKCASGVPFQETYYQGACGKMVPMSEIYTKVNCLVSSDFSCATRAEVLMLKDVLDNINNNKGIYVCQVNGI